MQVSIHAPARGATNVIRYDADSGREVSIHAPARGATTSSNPGLIPRQSFNSRPCERGDKPTLLLKQPSSCFNSRPCERGDKERYTEKLEEIEFQFTPLREGRHRLWWNCSCSLRFNSRPCERGDLLPLYPITNRVSFNSRPCERGDRLCAF